MESFKLITDENLENSETETTNRNSLEDFINEKFYETLVNKIKDEIKNAIVETSLNTNDITSLILYVKTRHRVKIIIKSNF